MDKNRFRKKYTLLRKTLSADTIEEFSLQIANNALQFPIWEQTYYHIFLPIATKNEVNTEYILHVLQGKDKSIVVSKTFFETSTMTHILLQENTTLKTSKYGIPEPVSGIEVAPSQLEVVFVPLLGYDTKGNRIGYGKGFYDQFLAQCSPKAIFVGLSFFEPEKNIPTKNTDIPLHFCVTPKNIYSF